MIFDINHEICKNYTLVLTFRKAIIEDGVAKSWVSEVHDVSLVVWEHLLVQLPAIERVNE
jgi:hypothetical protein